MNSHAFVIQDLVKIYPSGSTRANDGITLTIRQGEIFGLLGPNGSGKSTLVRQLAGLIRPTGGSIRLFGIDLVKEPHRASRYVAMQPQNIWLPAQSKPREILEITGRLRGMSAADARREADGLIQAFGLEPHLHKKMQMLSGGLRRLVAIAVTLIGNRPVVILDEPTNDLDPEVRRIVWQKIREASENGRTVILVTHNVIEAEATLQRVCIMRSGRVLEVGSPAELKSRFSDRIRLEMIVRPDKTDIIPLLMFDWPNAVQAGANRVVLSLQREETDRAIAGLLPRLPDLLDLRMMSPNLEDVYFELSGGDRIAS